ncbi:hypothetical protein ACJX0J_003563, partial (mitochondrion) [Zea mays]
MDTICIFTSYPRLKVEAQNPKDLVMRNIKLKNERVHHPGTSQIAKLRFSLYSIYTRTAATLISFLFAQGATRKVGLGQVINLFGQVNKGKNALYLFQYRLERNAKQRNEQTSDTLEGLPGMREQFIEALLLHGYTTLNPSLLASQNCDRLHHNSLTGPIYPKIAIRFPLSGFYGQTVLTQMAEYYTKQSEQGATVPVVENWRSCIGNWPYNSTIGKEAFRTSIHNNKEESRSNWKFPITFFFYLWLILLVG